MNILFLMADQLAPHFLPAYGHKVVKTPHLDEIAARSTIFDAHYTNAPLCVPARAGLMTGQLPSAVDVFDSGCDYAFSTPTFAHYLRAGGHVTPPACWNRYRHDDIDMPATPFLPPEQRDPHGRWLWQHYDRGAFEVTEDHVRRARHGYYGSIALVDDLVGRVMAALKATRLLDRTAIVFTADHGDMLGERGCWYKMSFHEHSCRVPLMVSLPGESGGRRIGVCTSLIDLLPTLLDMALDGGTGRLVEAVAGRSLMPLVAGDGTGWADETAAEILFEGVRAPGVMIRRGARKYVHWEGGPCSLFDLAGDPLERDNLVADPACAGEVAVFEAEVRRRWPLEELTRRILLKQRRNALVFKALMTGEVTPLDFQPHDAASKRYYRGYGNWHEAEARDALRFDR